MKIFVIYKTSGYMDDYHQYVCAATDDEQKAKDFVEKYNAKLKRIKDRLDEMFPEDEIGMRDIYADDLNHSYMYHQVLNLNNAFYSQVDFI